MQELGAEQQLDQPVPYDPLGKLRGDRGLGIGDWEWEGGGGRGEQLDQTGNAHGQVSAGMCGSTPASVRVSQVIFKLGGAFQETYQHIHSKRINTEYRALWSFSKSQ